GVLRNPWILAQAADLATGREPRPVTREMRGRFLLDYVDLLLGERVAEAEGFRHMAPTADGGAATHRPAHGRERWVINKIRALNAWFSKGLDGGSDFRVAINHTESIPALRDLVARFFLDRADDVAHGAAVAAGPASHRA
ncbi:MAG: dus 2, partial [Acidobacteria bacterium]|nr:dus 2 [Acidobacteriota bacterium]